MNRKSIEQCGKLLAQKGITISFAESATAGRLAMEFSLCPDSGKFLKGGLVCYDACLKEDILHVPKEIIETYTPESAQVTLAMAIGLRQLIKADMQVAVTGLTSAGGSETSEKPVGTMFFCGALEGDKFFEDRQIFEGTPEEIILQAVSHAATLLCKHIETLE